MLDFKNLYETHPDFHRYVERECNTYHKTIDQVLENFIVREVGKMYAENGKSPLVCTQIRLCW